MLPGVKINFENGKLGLVNPSADGLLGICCTGVVVASSFALNTAYSLTAYSDLATLGVTADNNPSVEKIIKEFYNEAPEGTTVWLMAFPDTTKLSEIVDKTKTNAVKLINAANGKLRGLIVSRTPDASYTPTVTAGLDSDVATAITNAQALGEWAATTKYAPIFTIIEGYDYSGTSSDLTDLTDGTTDNRVSVMIGDTVASSKQAAVGVLAGRLASIPVQRNIGRVKNGPLNITTGYIGSLAAEAADAAGINDKGYITFRTFVGRAGYFFNDDFTATASTDDYSHLTARRTVDKAARICYDTLLDELLDDVPVNSDGTLQAPLVKSWQSKVENAISQSMTANGELSADVTDPNDRGVTCYIDPTQNIVSTSKVVVTVSVRPFGYPRYIDVDLGFQALTS